MSAGFQASSSISYLPEWFEHVHQETWKSLFYYWILNRESFDSQSRGQSSPSICLSHPSIHLQSLLFPPVLIQINSKVTKACTVCSSASLLSQVTPCSEQVCMGSIMMPSQHVRRPEEVRTKEQLLPLAKEFIDQYYSSIKRQVCGTAMDSK